MFSILGSKDSIENFLSTLLTVIDTKSDLHVLVRLQVAIRQLLEEVEDNVRVIVLILIHHWSHLLLGSFSSLDQRQKLTELYFTVIVDRCDHIFDLLTRVYQSQRNQRVLQLIHSDGLRTILVQVIEAVVQDGHLLLVKVDVLALAMLAQPLALDTLRIVLI